MLKLVIGDRNYSSWSLRPWLAIRQAGLPCEDVLIRLYESTTKSLLQQHSPSGKVPCLIDGDTVVWDSLAICEYIAEKAPALWPVDSARRAEARSVSAVMHSGFGTLRNCMPMDIRAEKSGEGRSAEVDVDIARIIAIWESCRSRFAADGPFLFGAFSVADAMFSPVVWRFRSYGIELPPLAQAWTETMCALPSMQEWRAAALAEKPR